MLYMHPTLKMSSIITHIVLIINVLTNNYTFHLHSCLLHVLYMYISAHNHVHRESGWGMFGEQRKLSAIKDVKSGRRSSCFTLRMEASANVKVMTA